jgi:hypothetical protein
MPSVDLVFVSFATVPAFRQVIKTYVRYTGNTSSLQGGDFQYQIRIKSQYRI